MLQPREADFPALILAFVVLPLVAYIFLGIWSEAVKKKARISLLAQLAVEEACRVEAMTSADAIPIASSLKPGFYECARCCAPATTRCSRCKSVRYCSGKCQIIHWRQGHKQECQLWKDNSSNVSACPSFLEEVSVDPLLNSSKSSHGKDVEDLLHSDNHGQLPDDSALVANDMSHDLEAERKQSNKQNIDELKRVKPKPDGTNRRACHVVDGGYADTRILSTTFSREISLEDGPLGNKLGTGNFMTSPEARRNQGTSCPSSAENAINQTINLAGEQKNVAKQSGLAASSYGIDKHAGAEREHDANTTSDNIELYDNGFPSSSVTVDVVHSDHDNSLKGSMAYKKPPYTLGYSASPHKLENGSREHPSKGIEKSAYKENGSSVPQKNTSANDGLHFKVNSNFEGKMAESKRSPKNLKQNLVTLINNNKKNKMPRMLFPYENLVEFFQCELHGISPRGLVNCGNSCYANAVLQCLSNTKPLMVYLLRRLHSRTCFGKNWCLMCELEQHVSMLREGGGPFSPSKILSNMKSIGCRMGGGNQEDAHEFLRLLVMSMQSACLDGFGGEKEVDARLQETTLIQQIFGGRLRSIVKCLRCHQESERYENMMDLTLEIHGWVESLEDALTQFTAPEDLDGDNMYRCARCSTYVKARKQLSLHEVPNILTIVLKRFQTGKYGKINKCVTFPDMLDMIPFMTGTVDNPPLYLLYAVIVHLDNFNASFSGHYISYVKDHQGSWFRIDDSEVQAVPLSQVMSEGAYMLFYSRSFPRSPSGYIDDGIPSQVSTCATRSTSKNPKLMNHGQLSQPGTLSTSEKLLLPRVNSRAEYKVYSEDQATGYIPRSSNGTIIPTKGTYSDSMSADFSDATCSDWTLFTSSDDSSFTTESTRDSFSMVDCGDNGSISALSSIFSPFHAPEYSQKNSTISCTKFCPSKSQTRFFSESTGYAIDPSALNRPIGGCT